MAWALFLLVAGIWAVVLLPSFRAERFRFFSSPTRRLPNVAGETAPVGEPAGDPYRGSDDLDDAAEGWERHLQMLSRRRRAMIILAVVVAGSLVASVAIGGTLMLALQALADTALIWYVVTLRRIVNRRKAEESMPVMPEQQTQAFYVPSVRVVQSR